MHTHALEKGKVIGREEKKKKKKRKQAVIDYLFTTNKMAGIC